MSSSESFAIGKKIFVAVCPVNTIAMLAAAPSWGYLLLLAELGTLGTLYVMGKREADREM